MSKIDYDEGAQYKEALDIEQNNLQREMEMELEEKGDLKHQCTEVDKKKKQQENNHTRKDPCTQKQPQNTNHSSLARASKYKPRVHILMDNSDTLDQTAEKYST
eukprot:10382858-Ditylum_brightwellii.AAC.1